MSWEAILADLAVGQVLSKREELIRKLKLFFKKKRSIILYGASGAGKSQFLLSLENKQLVAKKTFSTVKSKMGVDDFPILLSDTPGHIDSKDFRQKERDYLIRNGVEGIINVVSGGYHESDDIDPSIAINGQNVKSDFIENNLQIELNQLSEWVPFLKSSNINWIITLVTKADIWWEDRLKIEKYYASGEYKTKFHNLSSDILHVTIPYCSIIKLFFDTKTSGKFDELDKNKLNNNFYVTLLNLLGKINKK